MPPASALYLINFSTRPPPDLPPAGGEEKYNLALIFNLLMS
jgi:hypothetical protein